MTLYTHFDTLESSTGRNAPPIGTTGLNQTPNLNTMTHTKFEALSNQGLKKIVQSLKSDPRKEINFLRTDALREMRKRK